MRRACTGTSAIGIGRVAIEVNHLLILFTNNTEPNLVGLTHFSEAPSHLAVLKQNIDAFQVG